MGWTRRARSPRRGLLQLPFLALGHRGRSFFRSGSFVLVLSATVLVLVLVLDGCSNRSKANLESSWSLLFWPQALNRYTEHGRVRVPFVRLRGLTEYDYEYEKTHERWDGYDGLDRRAAASSNFPSSPSVIAVVMPSGNCFYLMSRIVCSVFRSWILCPIVCTLAFSLVIYGSMIVSHLANPAIRFLGLELLGIPIFGVVGGLAVATGFNLSRAAIRPEFNTIVSRIPSAAFAGLALALNGVVAGWILMLPILAVWNSYDATVPLFLHAEDRDRSIQWSNIGALVFAVIAFIVGCSLHVLDSAQNKENG